MQLRTCPIIQVVAFAQLCLSAVGQPDVLECDLASPRYRASLYASMMVLEGAFRVRLVLPEGLDAVTLVGTVTEPGRVAGGAKALPGAVSGVYELPFILERYEPGTLLCHVQALDGESVVAEDTAVVTVMPRAAHEVVLDDNGVMLVQGVPVFGIGYAGPVPERLESLADAGFGLVLVEGQVELDVGQAWDPRVLAIASAPADRGLLAKMAASGAIGGWFIGPDWGYAALAVTEPYHPIVAYGEEEGDIVLCDVDELGASEAVAELMGRLAADKQSRPQWALLPSPQRIPGQTLTAMAVGCALAGARGVVIRSGDLSPAGVSAALGGGLVRLDALAPILLAPYAPLDASVDGLGVIAAVKRAGLDDYLVMVNLTEEAVTAICRGLGPVYGIDIATGESVAGLPGGAVTMSLDPWAVRVLRLRQEATNE